MSLNVPKLFFLLLSDFLFRRPPHPDQVMTLNYNGSKPLDLGTPPRLCYPLVIFLIRNDADETVHPDETVSTFVFVLFRARLMWFVV